MSMSRKEFAIDVIAAATGLLLAEAFHSFNEYVRTKNAARKERDGIIQAREKSNTGSDRDSKAVD